MPKVGDMLWSIVVDDRRRWIKRSPVLRRLKGDEDTICVVSNRQRRVKPITVIVLAMTGR